ncbi:MAG: winged helix-turn-helix transcriptional regulator [Nanoarchaeota archaeon]
MTSEIHSNNKILELNNRKIIYNFVKTYAGCHFRDLARKSKFPASSLKYHLDYLVKHELLIEQKDGNNNRYFPREFNPANKMLLGLLRQRSLREILLFILTNKNCTHSNIVKFTKLSPPTITWHLKKLENKGLISPSINGKNKTYKIRTNEKEIIDLLIVYKESFFDSSINSIIETWNFD